MEGIPLFRDVDDSMVDTCSQRTKALTTENIEQIKYQIYGPWNYYKVIQKRMIKQIN